MNRIEESPLYRIANARSIAYYGASNRVETMGSMVLTSILDAGFEGEIYPIHPKEKEVQGIKAYAEPGDLPEIPDLVIMVLPTGIVCQALEKCGKSGIKHAIVVSGGFKEVGGEGIELERQLLDISKKYGIRIVGPNCLGIVNNHHKLNSTPMFIEGPPGYIGLISQSGSFVAQTFNYLATQGLGFSTAISVGNETDIDMVDCLEYLAECPHTKVIALYIEGIKRGRAFIEAAKKVSTHKPIVAFYVGGSEAGRKAAFSHTGSLSGPDQLYDAAFRQAGIIRVHTVVELFDCCWTLGSLPKSKGRNVVIQTHSGGPGASAADACSRSGLVLPTLSDETLEALKPILPHTASSSNPVDLTFTQDQSSFFKDVPGVLMKDKSLDYLLVYLLAPEFSVKKRLMSMGMSDIEVDEMMKDMAGKAAHKLRKLVDSSGKPIVCFTYHDPHNFMIKQMIENGIPVFQDASRAVRAIKAVADYSEMNLK
jgi:acetate---CoA ligase (ADP-forming) subunit alpha